MNFFVIGCLILVIGILSSLIISEIARNKYVKLRKKIHPKATVLKRVYWPKKIEYTDNQNELNKIISVNNIASKIFHILLWIGFVLLIFMVRDRGR